MSDTYKVHDGKIYRTSTPDDADSWIETHQFKLPLSEHDAETLMKQIMASDNFCEAKDNWISVKDGLPEYEKEVIVYGYRKQSNPQMGGNKPAILITKRK